MHTSGRKHANLSEIEKDPFILPKDSHFTELIVKEHHHRALHSGAQLTLSLLGSKFWIIHARQLVKSIISECSTCIRHRAQTANLSEFFICFRTC